MEPRQEASLTTTRPLPGRDCPRLEVPLLDGGLYDIRKRPDRDQTLVVFYRGQHCGKCRAQLLEFEARIDDFAERGVSLLAVSMDDEEGASVARDDWQVASIPIAYALSGDSARQWGLFISEGKSPDEPREFNEPGLFLVDSEGKLFAAWIQSMPFARPQCAELLDAIDIVKEKNYPARGQAA